MNEQQFNFTIRADAYTADELRRVSVLTSHEESLVARLCTPAPLLLQGVRGSGKTSLLRLAELQINGQFSETASIGAYVPFTRYLLLENPSIPVGPEHPFRMWVSAKILHAIYGTAQLLTGESPECPSISPILAYSFDKVIASLEATHLLAGNLSPIRELPEQTQGALQSYLHPDRLNEAVLGVLTAFGLRSVNILCDEAAQYFKPDFQPLFFSILKALHSPNISFKAAIYPTVTYFGADFELGHDATVVDIARRSVSEDWLGLCRSITNVRTASPLWVKYPVLMESVAYAAFGIPRRFIELVGTIEPEAAREVDVLNAIKSHAQQELLQPFEVLKARIPLLVREVELGRYLLHQFVEDLKVENLSRAYRTAYIAVSLHRALPFAVRKAINLLVYLGILERQPQCKLGHSRESADRLLVNPALIISENLLADSTKRRLSLRETNERIRQMELDKFKEYGRNSKVLQEAVSVTEDIQTKPCPQCGADLPFEARFCAHCGTPQSVSTLLHQLLQSRSEELNLTPGVKTRLLRAFPTVGDVFRASDGQIDAIEWIGPIRVAMIRHAVEEFISG